jgi:Fe-S-cluster containining protein
MAITFQNIFETDGVRELLSSIEDIYAQMDLAYDNAASHYGFSCKGCVDNCCLTRFFHHTTVEYAYLLSGFFKLPRERRLYYLKRADAYNTEMKRVVQEGGIFSHMCPLNNDGLCVLYDYRPMICRLHGISHELMPPGRGKIFGAGCGEFEKNRSHASYLSFDRTPFYSQMAQLEREFRKQTGTTEKFKMTVAEMLISVEQGVDDEIY